MTKRRKQTVKAKSDAFDNDWLGYKPPIVSTIKDCRQLSEHHWQGIDTANGATVDVRGGPLRGCILQIEDNIIRGVIRLTPAA
jgi:hypothetical protein